MGGGTRLAIDSSASFFGADFRGGVALAGRFARSGVAPGTFVAVGGASANGVSTASKLDSIGTRHEYVKCGIAIQSVMCAANDKTSVNANTFLSRRGDTIVVNGARIFSDKNGIEDGGSRFMIGAPPRIPVPIDALLHLHIDQGLFQ